MSRPHFLQPLLRKATEGLCLYIGTKAEPLASLLESAFESATRTRGLLGRSELQSGTAFIIAPCQAVHTFGMQFAIDVIYAARDGRVVKIRRGMQAFRMSGALTAFAVIEMTAGASDRAGLKVGDRLEIR